MLLKHYEIRHIKLSLTTRVYYSLCHCTIIKCVNEQQKVLHTMTTSFMPHIMMVTLLCVSYTIQYLLVHNCTTKFNRLMLENGQREMPCRCASRRENSNSLQRRCAENFTTQRLSTDVSTYIKTLNWPRKFKLFD